MKTAAIFLLLAFASPTLADDHEPSELLVTVLRISEEYANVNTSVNDTTLAEHGLVHGVTFTARLRDRTVTPFLG